MHLRDLAQKVKAGVREAGGTPMEFNTIAISDAVTMGSEGMIGCGFWARYQLPAWQELGGAQCVAVCDRDRSKAGKMAADFNVAAVYEDTEALLKNEKLDFVDVVTGVDTHSQLVQQVAEHRLPVIYQKPLATSCTEAEDMVDACRQAGVPLLVHENWRWQRPMRQLKAELDRGGIGIPFRQVKIKVACTGICGTDLHEYDEGPLFVPANGGTTVCTSQRASSDDRDSSPGHSRARNRGHRGRNGLGRHASERGREIALQSAQLLDARNAAGPIGLMAIQAARIAGAKQIIAVEPAAKRQELAKTCGATDDGQGAI